MKYQVAVEETNIVYYEIEAENEDEAMELASIEGDCISSKHKQDEPLWAKEKK